MVVKVPTYFKQEKSSTCSLAVLRMVLDYFGVQVTEKELIKKIEVDYGKRFKNIWNPTIAKLACEYGIDTKMYALWPLFKKELLIDAHKEFERDSEHMSINKYENKNDTDSLPEPLPLAYKEIFKAIEKGCKVEYGGLTKLKLKTFLDKKFLIHTSIKLHLLYPGKKKGYHAILLYDYEDNTIFFHDPSYGESRSITFDKLLKATIDVGAFIVYKKKKTERPEVKYTLFLKSHKLS